LPGLTGVDVPSAARAGVDPGLDDTEPGPDVDAVLRDAEALLASVGTNVAVADETEADHEVDDEIEDDDDELADEVAWLHDFHHDDAVSDPGEHRDGEPPRDSEG
jgi:hypothetical protein